MKCLEFGLNSLMCNSHDIFKNLGYFLLRLNFKKLKGQGKTKAYVKSNHFHSYQWHLFVLVCEDPFQIEMPQDMY